jgi:hypothetical protein
MAKALEGAYPIIENNTPVTAWRNTVEAIANVFANDNPRFDRAKFYAAVGFGMK